MQGKRIKIPEGATHYRRDSKKRIPRIKFFYFNYREDGEIKKMELIPFRAREICFNFERNAYTIEYGEPDFYDKEGNNLKIDNC